MIALLAFNFSVSFCVFICSHFAFLIFSFLLSFFLPFVPTTLAVFHATSPISFRFCFVSNFAAAS